MILVDTSVVIEYARGKDINLVALLPTLAVAVCGVSRAELLRGARNPGDRTALLTLLSTFHQLPIPEAAWDDVGEHLAQLRAAGISVPFADAIIATVAIVHDVELWTRDNQFAMVQTVLPALRLFAEPP